MPPPTRLDLSLRVADRGDLLEAQVDQARAQGRVRVGALGRHLGAPGGGHGLVRLAGLEPEEPGPLCTASITVCTGSRARFSSATPPRRSTLARPQSTTCTSPKAPTMTFAGLRSRCSTPFECA